MAPMAAPRLICHGANAELVRFWQPQPWAPDGGLGGTFASLAVAIVLNVGPFTPLTLIADGPSGWAFGIRTVSWFAVAESTAARFGPKRTMFLVGSGSKPFPLILIMSPGRPRTGETPVITGAASDTCRPIAAKTVHMTRRHPI